MKRIIMGILSGMLFAAGVAFFSKKKLAAQKKEAEIKKDPTPESAQEKKEIGHLNESEQLEKTLISSSNNQTKS